MSVFANAGTTLKSTNVPGALLEVALLLNQAESAFNAANPTRPRNLLTLDISGDTKTANVTAALPIAPSISAAGVPQLAAKDYLGGVYSAFPAGTDPAGTKSTNIVAAFYEIASMAQALELTFSDADRPNSVQITADADGGSITITASLPVTESVSTDGSVKYTAVDYLA